MARWLMKATSPLAGDRVAASSVRLESSARFADFVSEGVRLSVWEGLRRQLFLGSEEFVEKASAATAPAKAYKSPHGHTAVRFPPALGYFAQTYPPQREAMARVCLSSPYTMKDIVEYSGVHYSTVSRAVRRLEKRGNY